MRQRTMVRSMLAALAALAAVTVLAAPAAAAAPDRAGETARSGWAIDLGGLLERAWGMLFGEREGGEGATDVDEGSGPQSVAGEEDGSGGWDPDG